MTQTPTELLAPYKAALVAAARDLLRAAGADGIAFDIPGSAPPASIVLGITDRIGELLRAPTPEPVVGGRRAGDPPAEQLTFDEPAPTALTMDQVAEIMMACNVEYSPGMAAFVRAIEAAVVAQSRASLPEVWLMVKMEPDGAMQVAGAEAIRFDTTALNRIYTANRVFRAMCAAAGQPANKGKED